MKYVDIILEDIDDFEDMEDEFDMIDSDDSDIDSEYIEDPELAEFEDLEDEFDASESYIENAILLEAATVKKKYKCPYCDFRGTKEELVIHVEDDHEDMIPEGYTAARVVFNSIYKKTVGSCIMCKDSTEWNEDTWRYERFCNKPACKEDYKERFKRNMIDVHGKETLLNDAEHQKKMLANRSISGSYTFRDGVKKTYTGTYELKALEFMDKVLEIKSSDLITPGPVFEYKFDEGIHQFITDMYYIPYNLVFDIKDGGDNPNNHPNLAVFRAKQLAKEKAIIQSKKYNYIRLTNNRFDQLLHIFAELKLNMVNNDDRPVVHINENMDITSAEDNNRYVIVSSTDKVYYDTMEYVSEVTLSKHLDQPETLIFRIDKKDIPRNIKELGVEDFIYDTRFILVEKILPGKFDSSILIPIRTMFDFGEI